MISSSNQNKKKMMNLIFRKYNRKKISQNQNKKRVFIRTTIKIK